MGKAVVAEKPSVARDLAAVLGANQRREGHLAGGGYLVTWAIGHLVGLAEPHQIRPQWKSWRWNELPMLPERWPLIVLEQTRAQFEAVKRVLEDPGVDEIICATDAGREGELIFRFVYEAAGCRKPVKRLWISSLTEDAIRDGFKKLRPAREFDPLAAAAVGRSRADWLVGMNLSRAYGLSMDQPLSVGRVQTPTLAMIVERELAIRRFVPEDYLEIVAKFSPAAGATYDGTYFREEKGEKKRRLPADGVEANAIVERVKRGRASVLSVDSQRKRMAPPLLYDLTELQRHANRLYGMSAQKTLEHAQALYEKHKLLSYPRTSSRHLSTEVAATAPAIVRAISEPYRDKLASGTGERPLSPRYVDDAKVTDHHAIIPTDRSAAAGRLSPDERKIYDLVCRRFLSAWHGDFVWDAASVVTLVESTHRDLFQSNGTAIVELGWKVLEVGSAPKAPREKSAEGESDEPDVKLPPGLRAEQRVNVEDVRPIKKKTQPPRRFNDATLLTAMETAGKAIDERELSEAMRECGLGTPATRAAIIETLLSRQYILRVGKAFEATEKGIGLIAAVDPAVKSPEMTGQWEARLQKIERGQAHLGPFIDGIEQYVKDVIGRMPPPSPKGGPKHDPRQGNLFGPPAPPPNHSQIGSESRATNGASPRADASARSGSSAGRQSPQRYSHSGSETGAAPSRAQATYSQSGSEVSAGPRPLHASDSAPPNAAVARAAASARTDAASQNAAVARAATPSARTDAAPPNAAVARATASSRIEAAPLNAAVPRGPTDAAPAARSYGLLQPSYVAPPRATHATAPGRGEGAGRPAAETPRVPTDPDRLAELLHARFGFAQFRPHQEEVCRAATRGEDLLLVMPTGAGKSLCDQLPGIARAGTTLVVCPLIALMEDQVAGLRSRGFVAERIHSGRERAESRQVVEDYLEGRLDFLFVAPERLGVPGFVETLSRRKPSLIAI
ncbi:MAG: DNA topoisomerase 3, partial [Myxococcaceae bacterium]